MMDEPKVDLYGGFSHVKIILSDALPASAFHPDFPHYDPNRRSSPPKEEKKGKET